MPLTRAIINKNTAEALKAISSTPDLNAIDRYGCTPLVNAAITLSYPIIDALLDKGANPNIADHMGCTPLYWAVDGDDIECTKRLLKAGANPNAYNHAGQPILLYPIIREHHEMVQLLVQNGAIMDFALDYIETKRIAHLYEVVGKADIVSPDGMFIEVDTEGFYLEFSLKQVMRSLNEFMGHREAQSMQIHRSAIEAIMPAIEYANELRYFKHRLADKEEGLRVAENMPELALLPFTYEGHAVTAVTYGPYFLLCDRGESKFFKDNISIYEYNPDKFTPALKRKVFLDVFSRAFMEQELPILLKFKKRGSINIPGQVAGNCSWANVEASVLGLLTLYYTVEDRSLESARIKAYEFFTAWIDWLKDWTLSLFLDDFNKGSPAKKAAIAHVLGLIFFQALDHKSAHDLKRAKRILPIISSGSYKYVLHSWAKAATETRAKKARERGVKLLKALGVDLANYL